MKNMLLCSAILTGILVSKGAVANVVDASMDERAKQNSEDVLRTITDGGPLLDSGRSGTEGSKVVGSSFQITSDDSNISLDFAISRSRAHAPRSRQITSGPNSGDYRVNTGFSRFSLKGSIPLNKDEENAVLDFKKFGNNGKISLSYSSFGSKLVAGKKRYDKTILLAAICIEKAGEMWLDNRDLISAVQKRSTIQDYLNIYYKKVRESENMPWDQGVNDALASGGSADFNAILTPKCKKSGTAGHDIGNDNDLGRIYAPSLPRRDYNLFKNAYLNRESHSYWGADASLGYNQFDVIDQSAFRTRTEERVGFDFNAYYGKVWLGGDASVRLSGGYTRGYEPADEASVCAPPDANGQSECIAGQDGKPDRIETGYAELAGRFILARDENGKPKMGIAPKVSYKIEDKDFFFELPVYLQKNSESGGLDAGIRIGYDTGSKKFGVGGFIGVPLEQLFGGL